MNTPTDSVRIVLFRDHTHQEILVLIEADDLETFKLPGGKFQDNAETPDNAAIRELWEELGVGGKDVDLRKAGELINDDGQSRRYIYFGFATESSFKLSTEVASIKWVSTQTIPAGKNKFHIESAVMLVLNNLKNNG